MSISGGFPPRPLPPRRLAGGHTSLPLTLDEAAAVAAALLRELERTEDAAEAATLRAVLGRLIHP